jgi:6-phosphogluconolactonase
VLIEVLSSPVDIAERAAVMIADRLWAAVSHRGVASLAVRGGRTPAAMFNVLAELPVPWSRVHVFQVDERAALEGSSDRNATMLTDELLRHIKERPAGVHLMDVTEPGDRNAAVRYALKVAASAPQGLDVVHLGLGDDGHTASWPPGDAVVESSELVAWSQPYHGSVRMTLTPRALSQAHHLVMTVGNASKSAAIRALITGSPSIPAHRLRLDRLTLVTAIVTGLTPGLANHRGE